MAITATKEQSAKERAALERIKTRNPSMSAYRLARFIHGNYKPEVYFVAADWEDVRLIRNTGKPFYGIFGVLRTAGVK